MTFWGHKLGQTNIKDHHDLSGHKVGQTDQKDHRDFLGNKVGHGEL